MIASEPLSGDRLRAARGGTIDDAEIMGVALAVHRSALRFSLSDADDAIWCPRRCHRRGRSGRGGGRRSRHLPSGADRVLHSPERSFVRRYLISFALAIATGACFILATVCLVLASFFSVRHPGAAWDVFAFLARWLLGVGFLSLAIGVLVHVGPATHQLPWVSLGTTIATAWWVIVSVGFYFYLTGLASYGSVFGSLASVIVAIAYLYISTTACSASEPNSMRSSVPKPPAPSPASKSTRRSGPNPDLRGLRLGGDVPRLASDRSGADLGATNRLSILGLTAVVAAQFRGDGD